MDEFVLAWSSRIMSQAVGGESIACRVKLVVVGEESVALLGRVEFVVV